MLQVIVYWREIPCWFFINCLYQSLIFFGWTLSGTVFRLNTQNFEGFFCASWIKFQDLHDQITNLDTLSSNLIDTFRWHWKYELITKLAVWRTEDSLLRYHPGMKAKNCLSQPVSFKGSLNKSSPVGSQWYKTYIRSNLLSIVSIWNKNVPSNWGRGPSYR